VAILHLQLTTNPGFEDLALDELRRLIVGAGLGAVDGELVPLGLAGHVHACTAAGWAQVRPLLGQLRSVHRVVRQVARFTLDEPDPLAQVAREVAAIAPSIEELRPVDATFRVSSSRTGTHFFTSEEVARRAGAGVRQVLDRKVSLKAFDVELRCDVRGETCLIGVQIGGLSRREVGPFSQRTSLRPNLAWCLLQLARPERPPSALLDPCCGAGTLLVEAGLRWPEVRLVGIDRREEAAAGARQNLAHHGLQDRAVVQVADARALGEGLGPFDTVVANPPFGHRLGQQLDLPVFYRDLLRSVARVCTEDARMVILAKHRGALNQAVREGTGWSIGAVRVVEIGGLYVGAFLLQRNRD
jgi:23S rRNA G2445 N2-methylase RlmL